MSWALALDRIKTSTPQRLEYLQDETIPDRGSVSVVFGAKQVEGEIIELTQDSSNFVSIREVTATGEKYVWRSQYDPVQVNAILEQVLRLFDSYRARLGYPAPTSETLNGWPILPEGQWQTANSPFPALIQHRTAPYNRFFRAQNAIDLRLLSNPFAEIATLIFGFIYDGVGVFNVQTLPPSDRYKIWFGESPAIAFEEAEEAHGRYTEFTDMSGTRTLYDVALAAIGLIYRSQDAFRLLEIQRLSLLAQLEKFYHEATQIPQSSVLQSHLRGLIRAGHKSWVQIVDQYALLHNQQVELIKIVRNRTGKFVRDVFIILIRFMHISDNIHRLFYGVSGFDQAALDNMRDNTVALGGSSMRENYYSGAYSFCHGELDQIARITLNRLLLRDMFSFGVQNIYYPSIFGGFNSNGGIGSNLNPQVTLHNGSGSQEPLNIATQKPRNDYHYRGLAHMAFDNYNLGGSEDPPDVKALVVRIKKQMNGLPQWLEEFATIDTSE